MDDNNIEQPAETPSDPSPAPPTPSVHRWPPLLAALGFALSMSGAIVEIVWWKNAGYGWEGIYRFFASGAPFLWSLALLSLGSVLLWAHWRTSDRKRWALLGLVIASMWLVRLTLGLAILAIKWVWNQAGADIVDASMPKKKRRKRRRKKPRRSHKGRRRYRRRGSRGRQSRRRRHKGRTRGRRPRRNRRRAR